MLYKNKNPLFIGHRGSPWKFTENTLESFLYAIESGADGVEMDVQITHDNQIIVFHDDFITDMKNKKHNIVNLSYYKLNEIFLKTHNQKIFLLREVLQNIPNKTPLNIELKSKSINNSIFIEKLGLILNQDYNQDYVVISSFNYIALYQYKFFFRNTKIGFLLDKINIFQICKVKFCKQFINPNFICCNYSYLTPQFLEWTVKNEIQMVVYTVNDFKDLEQCLERGVYWIITDNHNFYNQS